MPNKIIPELNYLLKEVEKHYGRPLKTSANFEALSIVIERDLGGNHFSLNAKKALGLCVIKADATNEHPQCTFQVHRKA